MQTVKITPVTMMFFPRISRGERISPEACSLFGSYRRFKTENDLEQRITDGVVFEPGYLHRALRELNVRRGIRFILAVVSFLISRQEKSMSTSAAVLKLSPGKQ